MPEGGGPPARSPHASLRLGVIDLEARPGPAAAHGHRSQAFRRPPHQWGWVADVWLGASSRSLARPRRSSQALWTPNVVWLVVLGFWGAPLCVVTNVVNRRCFSCGFLIRCYKRRQSDGFFTENQGFWTQIDDVCNMSARKGVQSALV